MSNLGRFASIKVLLCRRDFLLNRICEKTHASVTFDIQEMKALEWALRYIKSGVLSDPDCDEKSRDYINELIPEDRFHDRKGVVSAAYERLNNIGVNPIFLSKVPNSGGPIRAEDMFFPME